MKIEILTNERGRAEIRKMLVAQVFGRFTKDATDDPLPHLVDTLLTRVEQLEVQRDAARNELAHVLNVDRNVTDKCSGDWENCWCDTCDARRKTATP